MAREPGPNIYTEPTATRPRPADQSNCDGRDGDGRDRHETGRRPVGDWTGQFPRRLGWPRSARVTGDRRKSVYRSKCLPETSGEAMTGESGRQCSAHPNHCACPDSDGERGCAK